MPVLASMPANALCLAPDDTSFPEGSDVFNLTTPDDLTLRAICFAARSENPVGTVFVLQGRAEFFEKYGETFEQLLERGYAVMSHDWRGQGGSSRLLGNPRKGHVEDFSDYLIDLDCLIEEAKARNLPQPWHLLAHSMGGAIALLALSRGPSPFQRAVLSAPLVRIAGLKSPRGVRLLAQTLTSIGLATAFVPGGGDRSIMAKPFENNPLTRCEARYQRGRARVEAAPHLAIGDATIGWVDAAMDALKGFEAEDFGAANRTPVLMLLAGADSVVETAAAEELALRYRGASAIILPGARHELLVETDEVRDAFWAAFDAFVPRREDAGDGLAPEAIGAATIAANENGAVARPDL